MDAAKSSPLAGMAVVFGNNSTAEEAADATPPPPPRSPLEEDPLPDYVCCVVTEGVWTYFAATLLIVVLFAIATLKYCRKKLEKPKFSEKGHQLHLRSVLEDDRGALAAIRTDDIPVSDFPKHCAHRRKQKTVNRMEFSKAAEAAVKYSVGAAHKFKRLNQNRVSVPYEMNRVKLGGPGNATYGTDYINASYVDGYDGEPVCIVTQGPQENSVADFWQLVWQEGADVVVMLTRTFEFIKIMCVQYWPMITGKAERYGDFTVAVVREEHYAQYKVRHIRLTLGEESRDVTQYHFHGWHAYATPAPNAVLQFRRRLMDDHRAAEERRRERLEEEGGIDKTRRRRRGEKEKERRRDDVVIRVPEEATEQENQDVDEEARADGGGSSSGRKSSTASSSSSNRPKVSRPNMVVHCSDGGNRSGMFVSLLDLLSQAEETGGVSVYSCVIRMLSQRRSLLSSPEHLGFIYDVIEDEILCGRTSVAVEGLLSSLQHKSRKGADDGMNDYEREHKLLQSLLPRFTIGDCAAGHRAENRAKNRNVLIVPPDNNRPYLTSTVGNNGTDYINAVFVDGYRQQDEFVCTEWPMSNTVSNFWSMVHDFDLKTVVVLNNHRQSTSLNLFPPFWPQDPDRPKVNYGQIFCVEQKSVSNFEGRFEAWELMLMKQDISPKKFTSRSNNSRDLASLSSLLKSMQAPPKKISLFQIHCWPNHQKVPNSTLSLVQLIREVDAWRRDAEGNGLGSIDGAGRGGRGRKDSIREDPSVMASLNYDPNARGRVLVVSNDGYSRCGIYCAAAACLEQVRHSGEVDVFQAVKTIRKCRPQLVANPTEYKYCYDVVLHHVLNYCGGGGDDGGGDPAQVEEAEQHQQQGEQHPMGKVSEEPEPKEEEDDELD